MSFSSRKERFGKSLVVVQATVFTFVATLCFGATVASADPYHAGYDSQRESAREYRANMFCRPATGAEALGNFAGNAESAKARTLQTCAR